VKRSSPAVPTPINVSRPSISTNAAWPAIGRRARPAVEGSYDAALGALLAHPLVASYPAASAILDEYVERLAERSHR
jgi:hypothetical protein